MPLPLSASDITRIKRLERATQVVPLNNPFSYHSGIPNTQATSTFVLACIDPRFAYALEQYLDHKYAQNGSSYDLFILAGASMGGNLTGHTATAPPGNTVPNCIIVSPANNWQQTLIEHIQVAITLHNVNSILILDHLDCGAYTNCAGAGTDQLVGPHTSQYNTLINVINNYTFSNNAGTVSTGSAIFGGQIIGQYFDGARADTTTTVRDITTGNVLSPSVIEPKGINSGAKVLVLGCIDPRYSAVMTSFLTQYQNVQFIYDLFITAGASLGVNQSYSSFPTVRGNQATPSYPNNALPSLFGGIGITWGPTFFDHLSVARLLHQISEVWVFDHLDCGAYKLILNGSLSATDDVSGPHITEMKKLQGLINQYTNSYDTLNGSYSLSFKGFVIDKSGSIQSVIDDTTGTSLYKIVNFGTSSIRNPASTYTDLLAYSKGDYITQVQPLDMTANYGNTTGISQQKLTTLCTCSTVTNHLPQAPTFRSSRYQHLRIL